jgi:hypothetical protein
MTIWVRRAITSGGANGTSAVANVYVMLLAGHETTASTLSSLLLLLCLNPDEQEVIHKEITGLISSLDDFNYSLYPKLTKTMDAIREGLRLVGPVPAIQKQAIKNAVLPSRTVPPNGGPPSTPTQLVVPKGSYINLTYTATHYIRGSHTSSLAAADLGAAESWPNPYDYKPSRWSEDSATGGVPTGCTYSL